MSGSKQDLTTLLEKLSIGESSVEEVLSTIATLGFAQLGHSMLDLYREERTGLDEVVFGGRKDPAEVCEIAGTFIARRERVLLTRLSPAQSSALQEKFQVLHFSKSGRHASYGCMVDKESTDVIGSVAIVTAGTSDMYVAEEAELCSQYFGLKVQTFFDVGVASLGRILSVAPEIESNDICIVIAGMEGALLSVAGGILKTPVIGVPTSVGYGASLGGITPLCAMLSSCAPGAVVVNIDNGFGAAAAAAKLIKHLKPRK